MSEFISNFAPQNLNEQDETYLFDSNVMLRNDGSGERRRAEWTVYH